MTDEPLSPDLSPATGHSPPPPGSSIEVLEQEADRLVLFIPAGPRRGRELGCFGLLWTTVIGFITVAMLNGLRRPRGAPDPMAFLGLAPFWLVAFLLLYFSLKMRHTRTLLLIQRTRAVLQTTFFGRTKTREITLMPGEPATLVESYRQNDVPVDCICLTGEGRPLKFGTAFGDNEKTWIVERINSFLGVDPPSGSQDPLTGPMPTWVLSEHCAACGSVLPTPEVDAREQTCPFCGEVTKAGLQLVQTGPSDSQSAVGEFPADRVTIVEQTPDALEFGTPVFETGGMRRGAAMTFGIFALIWNGIVGAFVWTVLFIEKFNAGSLFLLIFIIPFVAVGLAVAGAAAFVLAGRLSVRLDREQLRASWRLGPLRYSKTVPTETITHVTVENSPLAVKNRRPRSKSEDTRTAIVWAGERWIPVTMLQGVNDCRHVAQLVRKQLADMGFQVADHRTPVVVEAAETDEEDDEDHDELEDLGPGQAGKSSGDDPTN